MTVTEELTPEQWLRSIWKALGRIESMLAQPVTMPAPVVEVPPPDLTDIVTAVLSLNGTGPTAEDIARAIAESLHFPTPEPDGSLSAVVDKLDQMIPLLRGIGNQQFGGGGGTVHFAESEFPKLAQAFAASSSSTVVTVHPATVGTIELGTDSDTRVAMNVYNDDGSGVMYVKFGLGATTEDYSTILAPGDYWESSGPRYKGPMTATWDTATGQARATEFFL